MKNKLIFALFVVGIFFLLGCTAFQSPKTVPRIDVPKTNIEFLFANEADFDTTIITYVNGKKVYENELISHVTAGGYFGQEFEYKVLEIPNELFSLEVNEPVNGSKITYIVDPANGKFISITFWGDKFIVSQTEEKKRRID